MNTRKHGRGNWQNPYSQTYHLSRAVQCVDCGTVLHKTHQFVYYGQRCPSCFQAIQAAGGNSGRS